MISEYQRSRRRVVCFALIMALLLTMVPMMSFAGNEKVEREITNEVTFGNLQILLNGHLYWQNGSLEGSEELQLKKGDNVTLKGEWSISKEVLATVSPGAYFLVQLPEYFDFRSSIDGQPLLVNVSGKEVKIGEFSLVEINGKYALKVEITNLYYEHPKTGRETRISSLTDGTFTAQAFAKMVTTEEPYYFTYGGVTLTGPAIGDGYDWGKNEGRDEWLKKKGEYKDGKYIWNIETNIADYVAFLENKGIPSKPALLIEDNLDPDDNRMVFNMEANLNARLPYYVLNGDGEVTDTLIRTTNITPLFTKVTREQEANYDSFVDKVKAAGELNGAAYGYYDEKNFVMYIKKLPGDDFKTNLSYDQLKERMTEYLEDSNDSKWKHYTQAVHEKNLDVYDRFYGENGGNIIGFTFDIETIITGAERDVENRIVMTWKGGTRIVSKDEQHFQSIDVTVKATNPGEIYITKYDTDEKGRHLSGAAFKLQKWDGAKFQDFTNGETAYTNNIGEVWFSSLDPGRYKIVEVGTVEGYDPKLNIQRFDNETKTYVDLEGPDKDEFVLTENATEGFGFRAFNARKTGSAKILKYDENDTTTAVAGAKFYLLDDYGEKVTSGGSVYYTVTDGNGVGMWTGLPWGTYTVKEEGAAVGYKEDSLKFINGNGTFTISRTDVEVLKVIKATNEPVPGEMILLKSDGDNNELKISGASFTLEKKNKLEDGTTTFQAISDEKGNPLIKKTDKDGVIKFGELEWGTYRIIELDPAPGYEKSSAVFTGGSGEKKNEFTIGPDQKSGQTMKALIDCENSPKKGNIKLIKKNANGSKFISGASFYLVDKKKGAPVKDEKNTTVYAVSDKNGIAEFKDLPWGKYEVFEYKPAYGYGKELIPTNGALKVFKIDASNAGSTIEIGTFLNNQGFGSFSMIKYSTGGGISSNPPIQGARFLLTEQGGATYTAISNSQGKVQFTNLPWGTYTVTEIAPAAGYEGDFIVPGKSLPYTFTINDQNENMQHNWTAYNTKKTGTAEIYKSDSEDKKMIPGVKFKLIKPNGEYYSVDGNVVEATSDENGIARFTELPWGTYTVTESAATTGYALESFYMENDTFTVDATNAGTTLTFSALNTKIKGSADITKKDAEDESLINGAEFYLLDHNGNTYMKDGITVTAITGSKTNGIASFTDLPWGSYTVKELNPAPGYKAGSLKFIGDNTTGSFTINETNAHKKITLTAENDRNNGKVKLTKSDRENGKTISGASFYLMYKDGIKGNYEVYKTTISGIYTTYVAISNSSGEAFFENLPWGDYELIELEAAPGYMKDSFEAEGGKTFSIDANNADKQIKLKATNSKYSGSVKITKLDAESENKGKIRGAKFYLTKDGNDFMITKNGVSLRYEVESDSSGVAKFTGLPWGDYEVKELSPAPGYKSESLKFVDENGNIISHGGKFTITKENAHETLSLTAQNDRILGHVKLLKRDNENNEKISGASFYLLNENNETYMTTISGIYTTYIAISNENGIAEFTNLPWGDYTVKELEAAPGYKKDSFTMSDDGKFTVGKNNVNNVINLSADNKRYTGGVKIYKTDSTDGRNISGASFYLIDQKGRTYMADGKTTTYAIVEDGIAKFDNLPWGTYTVKEFRPAEGYEAGTLTFTGQNGGSFTISSETVNQEITVTATNDRLKGKAVIYKKDAVNVRNISGASFYLTKNGEAYKENGTTVVAIAKSGKAEFTNLPWGEYEVKELFPAKGYENKLIFTDQNGKVNLDGGKFTLTDQNVSAEVVINAINDRLKGSAKIYKKDSTDPDVSINGAMFYLLKDGVTYQDENGTTVTAITTGDGVAVFKNLPWGNYEIKELNPASGYDPNSLKFIGSDDGKFELNAQNVEKEVVVTASNQRIPGKIQITKTDSINGENLQGASFYLMKNGEVYKDDKGTTVTAVTDGEGIAKFDNLPWDNYQIIELSPAKGYEPGSLRIENEGLFTIDNQNAGKTLTFDATNDRILGEIEIKKIDSLSTGKALQGAEFYLQREDGSVYMTTIDGISTTVKAVSESDGTARFMNLPWGTYTVRELQPPQGYEPGSLKFTDGDSTVTISKESSKIIKLTATNDRVTGNFKLQKMDAFDSDKKLSGGEFILEKKNENGIFEEVKVNNNRVVAITDIYGIAEFTDLEWGTYRVIEIKAPDGYDKDSLVFEGESNEFMVSAQEQHILYKAYNSSDTVLGEEGIPSDSSGGDSEGTVLGEEAKTADLFNWSLLIGTVMIAFLALAIAMIQLNRKNFY